MRGMALGATLLRSGHFMEVRQEAQEGVVADRVSAVTAVVRPVLLGTLYALQRDRIERLGGLEAVTLTDLAREYRKGDGDCGICFEYAVHDAIGRSDPLVVDRVQTALSTMCKIPDADPASILFGAEKSGAQRLVDTASSLLTDASVLMSGSRGRPVFLRRHLNAAVREFRSRRIPSISALPSSISGLWKADLFVGGQQSDRWVGTTVKINASDLEGARGLRLGLVPAIGSKDKAYKDEGRNLIVVPLPYDGQFMEVFYTGFNIVAQLLHADAKMPAMVALPNGSDRQVVNELVSRRQYPVLGVVDALAAQAQPHLLSTNERSVVLNPSGRPTTIGASTAIDTGALIAPVPRQ